MLKNIAINHISYNWEDIEIHFVGLNYNPIGVSSINYNTNHQMDYGYSRGGFPVNRKYGKWECSASITLDYFEFNKLKRTYAEVLNAFLPLDIKIIYKSKDNINGYIDTLYGCKLNYPNNVGGESGGMNFEITMDLKPVWIHYGK